MARTFLIVTQTDSIEQGKPGTTADNWMDDCAPSSLAAAANWVLGTALTSKDGMKLVARAGRKDRDGFGDPTTFPQIEKGASYIGLTVTWATSWKQVEAALLDESCALLVSVDQPKGYPASVRLSKWAAAHKKRTGGKAYGHLTAAVGGPLGAQWADPTMSGKGTEKQAIDITVADLRQIAASKDAAKPWRSIRIVRAKKSKPAITPIAASLPVEEPVAPVVAPVEVVAPPPVKHPVIRGLGWVVGRLGRFKS
jgi:hypothetical protein